MFYCQTKSSIVHHTYSLSVFSLRFFFFCIIYYTEPDTGSKTTGQRRILDLLLAKSLIQICKNRSVRANLRTNFMKHILLKTALIDYVKEKNGIRDTAKNPCKYGKCCKRYSISTHLSSYSLIPTVNSFPS